MGKIYNKIAFYSGFCSLISFILGFFFLPILPIGILPSLIAIISSFKKPQLQKEELDQISELIDSSEQDPYKQQKAIWLRSL
jgi:hypothetical protein